MTASRIAVTIPEQLARDARQAVYDGKAESVSAYAAEALRHYERSTTLRELLDQWRADDPADPHRRQNARRTGAGRARPVPQRHGPGRDRGVWCSVAA